MATVSFAPALKQQYFDSNGNPLSGGTINTYQSGTTTPQATYTDATGVTPNANPIVLDANGEANIWLDVSLSYKFVIKDSGGTTLRTVDGLVGLATNNSVATASLQDLAVTTAKLADKSVTSAKLANDASIDGNRAVTTNSIQNLNVTGQKIGYQQPAAKTTTYSIAATDDTIRVDGSSSAFTVTLPSAAGIQGRRYKVIRTDQTLANQITVGTTSSQTIGYNSATTFKLCTRGEMVEVESDGANWIITNRYVSGEEYSVTPTFTGFGTVSSVECFWQRKGKRLLGRYKFTSGTVTAVTAVAGLPSGLTTESSTWIPSITKVGDYIGVNSGGRTTKGGMMLATAAQTGVNFGDLNTVSSNSTGTSMITAQLGNVLAVSTDVLVFDFAVPISGWEG